MIAGGSGVRATERKNGPWTARCRKARAMTSPRPGTKLAQRTGLR